MKNKKLIITSATLIIIIILIGIGGYSIYKKVESKILKTKYTVENKSYDMNSINKIDIRSNSANIEFKKIEGSKINIEVKSSNENRLKAEMVGSELEIKANSTGDSKVLIHSNNKIVVEIPENKKLSDIEIVNDAGNIKLSNINGNEVGIEENVGNININNITAKTIEGEINTGNITGENVYSKNLILNTSLGNVSLKNNDKKYKFNKLDIETKLGDRSIEI